MTRVLGRLLRWPAPVFSLRAQMFLDCTRYTIREFSMARMNRLFTSIAPVAWKLVPRCSASPVVSLNAPALLGRSFWFGSADLSDSLSVILYIHGGGFCVGSSRMYPVAFQSLIDGSLAAGVALRVLSVEYPLASRAPGHEDESCVADHPVLGCPVSADHREPDDRYGSTGFQSQLATCIAAFDYLQDELGIPAHAIVIAGDSAGGNLAIGTALAIRDRAWRQGAVSESALRSSLPAALLLFSPWTDLSASALWRRCPSLLPPTDPLYAENLDFLDPDICQTFVEYQSANSNNWIAQAWARGMRNGWEVGKMEEPPSNDFATAGGMVAAEDWSPSSSSSSSSASSRRASASAASFSSATLALSPELTQALDSVQESPPPPQPAAAAEDSLLPALEPPEHEDDGRGSPEGEDADADDDDDEAQQPRQRRQAQRQQRSLLDYPDAASSSSSDASVTPSSASAAATAASPSSSASPAPAAGSASSSSFPAPPRIDLSYPLLSPIYADLAGLPPVRLCYGRREMLLRDILAFQSALEKAGVEVSVTTSPERAKDGSEGEATTHNYALAPEAWGSTARRSLREIARFVSATLLQAQQKHTTTKTALARNLFSTAHFIDAQ